MLQKPNLMVNVKTVEWDNEKPLLPLALTDRIFKKRKSQLNIFLDLASIKAASGEILGL
jgi:hypothetical protein